jgi:hypothetical protein
MPEDDAVQEVRLTIVSSTTPTISFEDEKAYVNIETFGSKEPCQEDLDEFVKGSTVDTRLGENGSLRYERPDGSLIIVPNNELQALNFVNAVIEREERDNVLSETEIVAKNRAIQLEDASKNLRDWSNSQPQDMYWENNRVKFKGERVNLNASTLLSALVDPQIIGEKVRLPYRNSKGEESIYYFSLDQASRIIDISNNQNLAETKEKIDIVRNKEIPSISFVNPEIKGDNIISNNRPSIPAIYFEKEHQVHRAISENDGSFTISLYVKGSGNPYRLDFSLEGYNKLLKETA